MTLTDTRPLETPAEVTQAPVVVPETWLTTSDHKRLGSMYVVAALVFLLIGNCVGIVMELQRSQHHGGVAGDWYSQLFSMHSTLGTVFFLAPLWVGLATYLVPLQIGARRLAFPRLQALAFWMFVAGGLLFLAAYAFGKPNGAGIVLSRPLEPVAGGASRATDLWAASLVLATIASVLAASNILTTVMRLRAHGMTLGRVPAFTWSALATSVATMLASPIFVAGMVLVYLDQHFGGHVFAASQVNANLVWQHLVWLYGRPDVYLLFLPALGVISDVVATHARRPLFMSSVAKAAIFIFAVLSFGILAANAAAEKAVLLPTPTLVSATVVVPVGVCVLLWLATVRPAELHLHVSLLYGIGFVVLCLLGGLNTGIAAIRGVDGGTAWTTGQIHAVLIGAPMLAAFAGIYHWAPKIWGRELKTSLGIIQWLLLLGGFIVSATGSWLLGYDGAPWHVADLTGPGSKSGWLALERLSGAGGVLIAVGVIVFVVNLVVSVLGPGEPATADPYDGATLEWVAESPPPEDNFAYVPEVRSESPLWDLRAASKDGGPV